MAALGGKIVLFGGSGATAQPLADTWEWDAAKWSQRTVTGPSGREAHAMASVGGKVVLFGGYDGSKVVGDTWEWDGNVWSQRMVSGPKARQNHAMATLGGKALLFGGSNGAIVFDDVWQWDGTAWMCVSSCSDPADAGAGSPSARGSSAMAPLGDGLVLFGGYDTKYEADTWTWSPGGWSAPSATGPAARWEHSMAAAP
jgi:hypothetical protein